MMLDECTGDVGFTEQLALLTSLCENTTEATNLASRISLTLNTAHSPHQSYPCVRECLLEVLCLRIVPGRHGLELQVEGVLLFFQASLLHNLVFVVSVFVLLCDCASGIVCSLLCLELLFRAGDGMLLSLLDLRCQIVDGV